MNQVLDWEDATASEEEDTVMQMPIGRVHNTLSWIQLAALKKAVKRFKQIESQDGYTSAGDVGHHALCALLSHAKSATSAGELHALWGPILSQVSSQDEQVKSKGLLLGLFVFQNTCNTAAMCSLSLVRHIQHVEDRVLGLAAVTLVKHLFRYLLNPRAPTTTPPAVRLAAVQLAELCLNPAAQQLPITSMKGPGATVAQEYDAHQLDIGYDDVMRVVAEEVVRPTCLDCGWADLMWEALWGLCGLANVSDVHAVGKDTVSISKSPLDTSVGGVPQQTASPALESLSDASPAGIAAWKVLTTRAALIQKLLYQTMLWRLLTPTRHPSAPSDGDESWLHPRLLHLTFTYLMRLWGTGSNMVVRGAHGTLDGPTSAALHAPDLAVKVTESFSPLLMLDSSTWRAVKGDQLRVWQRLLSASHVDRGGEADVGHGAVEQQVDVLVALAGVTIQAALYSSSNTRASLLRYAPATIPLLNTHSRRHPLVNLFITDWLVLLTTTQRPGEFDPYSNSELQLSGQAVSDQVNSSSNSGPQSSDETGSNQFTASTTQSDSQPQPSNREIPDQSATSTTRSNSQPAKSAGHAKSEPPLPSPTQPDFTSRPNDQPNATRLSTPERRAKSSASKLQSCKQTHSVDIVDVQARKEHDLARAQEAQGLVHVPAPDGLESAMSDFILCLDSTQKPTASLLRTLVELLVNTQYVLPYCLVGVLQRLVSPASAEIGLNAALMVEAIADTRGEGGGRSRQGKSCAAASMRGTGAGDEDGIGQMGERDVAALKLTAAEWIMKYLQDEQVELARPAFEAVVKLLASLTDLRALVNLLLPILAHSVPSTPSPSPSLQSVIHTLLTHHPDMQTLTKQLLLHTLSLSLSNPDNAQPSNVSGECPSPTAPPPLTAAHPSSTGKQRTTTSRPQPLTAAPSPQSAGQGPRLPDRLTKTRATQQGGGGEDANLRRRNATTVQDTDTAASGTESKAASGAIDSIHTATHHVVSRLLEWANSTAATHGPAAAPTLDSMQGRQLTLEQQADAARNAMRDVAAAAGVSEGGVGTTSLRLPGNFEGPVPGRLEFVEGESRAEGNHAVGRDPVLSMLMGMLDAFWLEPESVDLVQSLRRASGLMEPPRSKAMLLAIRDRMLEVLWKQKASSAALPPFPAGTAIRTDASQQVILSLSPLLVLEILPLTAWNDPFNPCLYAPASRTKAYGTHSPARSSSGASVQCLSQSSAQNSADNSAQNSALRSSEREPSLSKEAIHQQHYEEVTPIYGHKMAHVAFDEQPREEVVTIYRHELPSIADILFTTSADISFPEVVRKLAAELAARLHPVPLMQQVVLLVMRYIQYGVLAPLRLVLYTLCLSCSMRGGEVFGSTVSMTSAGDEGTTRVGDSGVLDTVSMTSAGDEGTTQLRGDGVLDTVSMTSAGHAGTTQLRGDGVLGTPHLGPGLNGSGLHPHSGHDTFSFPAAAKGCLVITLLRLFALTVSDIRNERTRTHQSVPTSQAGQAGGERGSLTDAERGSLTDAELAKTQRAGMDALAAVLLAECHGHHHDCSSKSPSVPSGKASAVGAEPFVNHNLRFGRKGMHDGVLKDMARVAVTLTGREGAVGLVVGLLVGREESTALACKLDWEVGQGGLLHFLTSFRMNQVPVAACNHYNHLATDTGQENIRSNVLEACCSDGAEEYDDDNSRECCVSVMGESFSVGPVGQARSIPTSTEAASGPAASSEASGGAAASGTAASGAAASSAAATGATASGEAHTMHTASVKDTNHLTCQADLHHDQTNESKHTPTGRKGSPVDVHRSAAGRSQLELHGSEGVVQSGLSAWLQGFPLTVNATTRLCVANSLMIACQRCAEAGVPFLAQGITVAVLQAVQLPSASHFLTLDSASIAAVLQLLSVSTHAARAHVTEDVVCQALRLTVQVLERRFMTSLGSTGSTSSTGNMSNTSSASVIAHAHHSNINPGDGQVGSCSNLNRDGGDGHLSGIGCRGQQNSAPGIRNSSNTPHGGVSSPAVVESLEMIAEIVGKAVHLLAVVMTLNDASLPAPAQSLFTQGVDLIARWAAVHGARLAPDAKELIQMLSV